MAGERNYLRVPPDSTGKRVRMKHTAQVFYSGKSSSENPGYIWVIGEFYSIAGLGNAHLHGYQQFDADTGVLEVHYNKTATYNNTNPTVTGNIVDNNTGDQLAVVTSFIDVFINTNHIIGYDNPEYGLNVDRFGALYTRWTDGSAELSQMGSLKANGRKVLAEYVFQNSILPTDFSNTLVNGGTVAFDNGKKCVALSCPTTSGAVASHTSNLYHPYTAGMSNSFLLATRVGDSGKANVTRRWGAFDNTDGLFFELAGTTLNVVHRYTFDGVTTNGTVPQSSWNTDKLDGTGSSGYSLDLTKNNLFWVDYQFIGGGSIRWGIVANGERLVAHEMYMNSNNNSFGNPHRPVCWAQTNTGTAGSTSELFAYGASVETDDTETNFVSTGDLRRFSHTGTIPASTTSTTYQFSMAPNLYLSNGDLNRSYYSPIRILASAFDSITGADVKVQLRIFQKCQMRGVNYVNDAFSTTEFDTSGDHLGHGPELLRKNITGEGEINVLEYLDKLTNTVHNNSEILTAVRTQAITGITAANPAIVTFGTNPLTGQVRHLFDDRQRVTVENISETTAAGILNNNQYYIAYTTSNKAALYVNEADLLDDRATRVLSVSSTTNVVVGDTITINSIYTANVVAVGAGTIEIDGRSSLLIDGVSAVSFTTTSGGSGTVNSVAVSSNTHYPKDYDTYLRAVDGSTFGSVTNGNVKGTPPAQPAWTFMAKPIISNTNPITVDWTMMFKEVVQ